MQCEMCGSEEEELFRVDVEGAILRLCKKCSRFGKVLERVRIVAPAPARGAAKQPSAAATSTKHVDSETIFVISPDYPIKLKNMRERLGLKQDELAKKINERETLIHKLETGTIEPNLMLARKLEKFLNIKLVEEHKEEGSLVPKAKKGEVTLGDFARIKKR